MKYETQDLKSIKVSKVPVWIKIIAVLAFAAMLIWSVILVRDKLLKNADEMGMYLAQSYALEEEHRVKDYSMLITMCAEYTNDGIDSGADDEDISAFLNDYVDKAKLIIQDAVFDPYAVINGKIVAAVPWEGDTEYDYEKTQWYEMALRADGDVIYTDSYVDAITQKEMVTLAIKLHGNSNVLAFDIIMENFHANRNMAVMPDKSSYLLYDSHNKLIYYTGDFDENSDGAAKYSEKLVRNIRAGKMSSHDATIVDLQGRSRAVYYYEMSNGWLSVITIPISEILQDDWNNVLIGLAMVCVLIIGVMIIIVIRGYIIDTKLQYIMDTLRFLGDSYYEIYRVNYKTGLCRAVKQPEDMKGQDVQTYSQLLKIIKSKLQDSMADKMESDFNMDNIRQMISNGIFEFQKEYKRKFGNDYEWISVQMIYKQTLQINEVILCFKKIDNPTNYNV